MLGWGELAKWHEKGGAGAVTRGRRSHGDTAEREGVEGGGQLAGYSQT